MTTTDSDYDEIDRISQAITDHKLDYTEAIKMVVACIEHYDSDVHARWAPRKFFRAFASREFASIRNARAAVQAFELLRAERFAEA